MGGFFNGYMTTVLRDVPFSMIQFPLYEAAKVKWKGMYPVYHPKHSVRSSWKLVESPVFSLRISRLFLIFVDWKGGAPSPIESAICGSVTGGIAAALTTPTDVVKTRLMLQTGSEVDQGVITTVRNIYIKEGLFIEKSPRLEALCSQTEWLLIESRKKLLICYRDESILLGDCTTCLVDIFGWLFLLWSL